MQIVKKIARTRAPRLYSSLQQKKVRYTQEKTMAEIAEHRDSLPLNAVQVFLGYALEEALRMKKYSDPSDTVTPGYYSDYFGIRTHLEMFNPDRHVMDQKLGEFPFPDDGLHDEAIEYLSCIDALERAGKQATVIELGAGYAPWLTFCAKVAMKRNIERLHLFAVEADPDRKSLMQNHFKANGLPFEAESKVKNTLISSRHLCAGVSDKEGVVMMNTQGIRDWGGTLSEVGEETQATNSVEVPCHTINTLLEDYPLVDVLHLDIQGWEFISVKASLETLNQKVRSLLIGTHSRTIEGNLQELLYSDGWRLVYEKPCKLVCGPYIEEVGQNICDGFQYWHNARVP